MKVTDIKIEQYCGCMGYKLLRIGKIAFEYQKPNGDKSALLKSAAHSLDHKPPLNKVDADRCATCGAENAIMNSSIGRVCYYCGCPETAHD